ncbi:MAG: DUF4157 domain-containing protein [Desulfobacca sp.]|nr:DUF4157 domain-containing protein [Desulfobacca sp.]
MRTHALTKKRPYAPGSRFPWSKTAGLAPKDTSQWARIRQILRNCPIQAKLNISSPGDIYEQEADKVADAVMHMPDELLSRQPLEEDEEELLQTKRNSIEITPFLQRQIEPEEDEGEEEEEKVLQAKTDTGGPLEVRPELEADLAGIRGAGQPLPELIQAFFEPRLGIDLGGVRIHVGSHAAKLAHSLNARAFTLGQDVVFGRGEYAPETPQGKSLLAHELTHVIQQGGGYGPSLSLIPQSLKTKLVQRAGPFAALKAAEWIALGAAGYVVAQDATKASAGDISYTFDEMEGVLLPGGGNDVPAYRATHAQATIRTHTFIVSTWQGYAGSRKMGIKFGITFNYDGHAIGNISCNILDIYDWPLWAGSVNVNFTPLSLAKGDVAVIRITLNLNADRTFAGGRVQSRILELDGSGTIRKLGRGAYVRFS